MMAFDTIRKLKSDYEKAVKETGKDEIRKEFEKFFTRYPAVHGVVWTQYTPYFNDGDACTFCANDMFMLVKAETNLPPSAKLSNERFVDNCFKVYFTHRDTGHGHIGHESELHLAVNDMPSIPEYVLEVVFGDHVQVVATRAGFEVCAYEHD